MRRVAIVDWHVAVILSATAVVAGSLVAVVRVMRNPHLIADATMADGAIVAGLMLAVGALFKVLMATKDREHEAITVQLNGLIREKERDRLEMESLKKSYAEVAAEATKAQTDTVNFYRNKEGKPPLIPLAPVISESHSPSTAAQRETAYLQTLRAQVAAAKLAEGLTPRQEPAHAEEVKLSGEIPSPMPTPGQKIEVKGEITKAP